MSPFKRHLLLCWDTLSLYMPLAVILVLLGIGLSLGKEWIWPAPKKSSIVCWKGQLYENYGGVRLPLKDGFDRHRTCGE